MYKECGWLTLSQRSQQRKLSFRYNVNAGLVLSYISDLIPPLVSEISDYPLRYNRNISFPYNRTNISQKSCIPSSISLWDGLEDDLKNLSNLTAFKNMYTLSLTSHTFHHTLPLEIDIYQSYIILTIFLHVRLRNRCSNLNNDLIQIINVIILYANYVVW